MGFMDKAKKLAEQAQQKLDEAQKNFNQSGSPQSQPQEATVRYDEHGRPIREEAGPADASPTPPPPADAAAESGGGGANASPDPFKPLKQ